MKRGGRFSRKAATPSARSGSAPSSFAPSRTMVQTIRQASVEIRGYSVASGQERAHAWEAARDALRRVRARHRQSLRRMALRRRGDQQQRPVGHPGDRPPRRAWQVRPPVRVRRARHGPRGSPIISLPVRADHAHLGPERLDAAHRPRRHRVDQLRRALPRRPDLRLARPHHQGSGRLERCDELGRQGRAQLQPRSPHGARPALRGRPGVRRRRQGPLGLLGGRGDRRGQGDRRLHRPVEGSPARPSWPVLPGEGPHQHGPLPSGSSGHHSSGRLGGRARARRADGRRRVLRRPGAVGRAGVPIAI